MLSEKDETRIRTDIKGLTCEKIGKSSGGLTASTVSRILNDKGYLAPRTLHNMCKDVSDGYLVRDFAKDQNRPLSAMSPNEIAMRFNAWVASLKSNL